MSIYYSSSCWASQRKAYIRGRPCKYKQRDVQFLPVDLIRNSGSPAGLLCIYLQKQIPFRVSGDTSHQLVIEMTYIVGASASGKNKKGWPAGSCLFYKENRNGFFIKKKKKYSDEGFLMSLNGWIFPTTPPEGISGQWAWAPGGRVYCNSRVCCIASRERERETHTQERTHEDAR